jgi:hypothetical protein
MVGGEAMRDTEYAAGICAYALRLSPRARSAMAMIGLVNLPSVHAFRESRRPRDANDEPQDRWDLKGPLSEPSGTSELPECPAASTFGQFRENPGIAVAHRESGGIDEGPGARTVRGSGFGQLCACGFISAERRCTPWAGDRPLTSHRFDLTGIGGSLVSGWKSSPSRSS